MHVVPIEEGRLTDRGYAFGFTLLAGFVGSLVLTPLAIRAARRWRILDSPNTALKTQDRPIPYLGGLALFGGFALSLVVSKAFFFPHPAGLWPAALDVFKGVVSIFLGAFLCTTLGLVDDRWVLSARVKFMGQVAAALILVLSGLRLRFVPEVPLSILLTVLWVVGVSNALNFVDIMDGLAAGVAALAAGTFFLFSLHAGRFNDSIAALALAGSCLGFLGYNFRPARIYMGDAGSLFLGFTLAALALNEQYSHQNGLAVLSPLLILALPLFDVALMTVIRLRRGIRPWQGSPDHVPLRLKALGWDTRAVVLILYAVTAALGLAAYGASFLSEAHALLAWLVLGALGLAVAGWLMSIRMPYEK
jgi:UDP-GlcNAc:undecaprenyl-phosphate GlcNAc-1-phosphate transferase